jgi:hypothetical protein
VAEQQILVLDANVFMEAARRYYAFEIAPGFWEALVLHASEGRIRSIDRVKREIEKGKGALADWAEEHFAQAFLPSSDDRVTAVYGDIMRWVTAQGQFFESAKAKFADEADGWLIAYAKVERLVVVTQEVLRPDIKRKVPIPNVCTQFGVSWIDTFEMLRRLQIRLK